MFKSKNAKKHPKNVKNTLKQGEFHVIVPKSQVRLSRERQQPFGYFYFQNEHHDGTHKRNQE